MSVEAAVRSMLVAIGEDPERPGLRDTPARVARFWAEFLAVPDDATLDRTFDDAGTYDEMILLRRIPFYSMCEHHMLPFSGLATVAYVPDGQTIIGLSKLARIVRKHAGRLQVQERLTSDIADEVQARTRSATVGVSLEAVHLCMAMRGVRIEGASMVTNVLRGDMRDDARTRAEFLAIAKGG